MEKKKAKAKVAARKRPAPARARVAAEPAPAAPKPIILSSPVHFMSPEGPLAAVVHAVNGDGTLDLSVFTGDQIVKVHRNVQVGNGESGTCRRADV